MEEKKQSSSNRKVDDQDEDDEHDNLPSSQHTSRGMTTTALSIVSFFKKENHSSFPFIIEWILSWIAAIFLASYLGYCYILISTQTNSSWIPKVLKWPLLFFGISNKNTDEENDYYCHHVPLTTPTRGGHDNKTESLASVLDKLEQMLQTMNNNNNSNSKTKNDNRSSWDDDELTSHMHSTVEARQLASKAMSIHRAQYRDNPLLLPEILSCSQQQLWKQIQKLWPQLLQLPPIEKDGNYAFQVSLIVPAFGEQGSIVQSNLQRALSSCEDPSRVQLIIVDAGKNTDIDLVKSFEGSKAWGNLQLVTFSAGGGRGPTLNFGAQHATGKIITFLHSDNILPDRWDQHIVSCFTLDSDQAGTTQTQSIACAFSFYIDTSKEALENNPCPPGLSAAQWLGKIRTEKLHVLYGDSVLSLPATYFRFFGGYPEQALMEDYELMNLLRKRVSSSALAHKENIRILPAKTLISPRRWRINGVPYVILFNSLCVFLYEHQGWSPEELFTFYYQRRSR